MASTTTKIQTIVTYSGGVSGSITGQVTDTGTTFNLTSPTFAAASTNVVMAMAFVKANLQSFYLKSDQNCTVKTNSSGSPSDTITLVANVPYFWSKSSGLTNPFATDVTTSFVTCTPAASIQMEILQT